MARHLVFRKHAVLRMLQRGIRAEDVEAVLASGEVVEEHPEDHPSQAVSSSVGPGFVRSMSSHQMPPTRT